jgi:hypothetical protein
VQHLSPTQLQLDRDLRREHILKIVKRVLRFLGATVRHQKANAALTASTQHSESEASFPH